MSLLTATDVGHRVIVRHRLIGDRDGHGLTDALGVLQELDADSLLVRHAGGTVRRILIADVVAAKPIPPMPLRRVDLDRLLLTTALGRPAVETQHIGDWLLRASSGWTGRANSLLPVGEPGIPLAEALARTAEFYRTRACRRWRWSGWAVPPRQTFQPSAGSMLDLINPTRWYCTRRWT